MSWLDDLLLRLEMTVAPGSTPDLPPRPVTERLATGISPALDRAANVLGTEDRTLLDQLLKAGKVSTDWERKIPGADAAWNRLWGTMHLSPETAVGFEGITRPKDIGEMADTLTHELRHATGGTEEEAQARAAEETQRWTQEGRLTEDQQRRRWHQLGIQRFLQQEQQRLPDKDTADALKRRRAEGTDVYPR